MVKHPQLRDQSVLQQMGNTPGTDATAPDGAGATDALVGDFMVREDALDPYFFPVVHREFRDATDCKEGIKDRQPPEEAAAVGKVCDVLKGHLCNGRSACVLPQQRNNPAADVCQVELVGGTWIGDDCCPLM